MAKNKTGGRLDSIRALLIYVMLMWLVYFLCYIYPLHLYGIRPRNLQGAIGIITHSFLHGNLPHLVANTMGLLTFGLIFILLEGKKTLSIIIFIMLTQGILVWLFARDAIHIGASGLIFGLFGYLLMIGFFSKKIKYIFVSIFVLIFYGGMIFGVLPVSPQISWEGHLFGAIAGGVGAKFSADTG